MERRVRHVRRPLLSSLRKAGVLGLVGLFLAVTLVVPAPEKAHAVTASDWRAGHIIDDAIFFNKDSMTVGQIQEFLNAKVPTCNRWHSSSSSSNQPPFTCLKEYYENPTTHENNIGRFNADGSPGWVSGGQSAAQIIWNAAQTYGINPQVLIVLLQKEQTLITDDWPWRTQYQKATGYYCPDTAPCDTQYYGFYNQVTGAAWQFRQYGNNPTNYNYRPGVTRYIGYSPDSSCGGSNVFIENQATANLYNYTPYQPNQGALNAGWGTAYCGAYGNRNFWLYFNNWFGSTNAGDTQANIVTGLSISPSSNIVANDQVHARFTVRNNTSTPLYVGGMSVAVRRTSDYANFDYPLRDVTIPPRGMYTYDEYQALPAASYSFEIVNYRQGVGWSSNYPYSLYDSLPRTLNNIPVQPAIYLSTGLSLTTTNNAFVPDKNVMASFKITNPSGTSVSFGRMAVIVRDSQGRNFDFEPDDVVVPANGTYTYSKTRTFSSTGDYTLSIANYREGIGWNESTPASSSPAIVRSLTQTVKPNPRTVSNISITPANPVVGQNVSVSFQIRNDADAPFDLGLVALAARGPQGQNVDFQPATNVSIPANSTYTYSATRTFSDTGKYNFYITSYHPSRGWRDNYPVADGGISTAASVTVGNNPVIVSGLTASPVNAVAGRNVTVSFQIRNDAEEAIDVGRMAVAARDPQGRNVDFAPEDVTIAPHTTYTYSKTQTLMKTGYYNFSIVNYRSTSGWSTSYPLSANGSIARELRKWSGNNPLITTSLTLNPVWPAVGQTVTASFVVTNNGDVDMPLGLVALGARDPQGKNVDLAPDLDVVVPAKGTYTYTKTTVFNSVGDYSLFILNRNDEMGWNQTYPAIADDSIVRALKLNVRPNPRIVSSLTVTPANPIVGQSVTATFQIRNDASTPINVGTMTVAARGPQGQNLDFVPDTNVTIPANSTYTFSRAQTFSAAGQYKFFITNYRAGIGWSEAYPLKDNSGIATTATVNVSN